MSDYQAQIVAALLFACVVQNMVQLRYLHRIRRRLRRRLP